jgi:DNA-binding transcriptional regulator YiaG
MDTPRRKKPRYRACKDVLRLRKAGWTYEAIARALKASTREVYRWQAGDSRPLGVYADMLAALPTEPERVSRHYKFRPEEDGQPVPTGEPEAAD